jgi:hypothetical protein
MLSPLPESKTSCLSMLLLTRAITYLIKILIYLTSLKKYKAVSNFLGSLVFYVFVDREALDHRGNL